MTDEQLAALRAAVQAAPDYPALLKRLDGIERRLRDVEDDRPYEHEIAPSTVEALATRRNGLSLRKLAESLGYKGDKRDGAAATLGAVLKGRAGVITAQAEADLRRRLGLGPSVTPCPICGHALPAHHDGADALQRHDARRLALGLTWPAYLTWLDDLAASCAAPDLALAFAPECAV